MKKKLKAIVLDDSPLSAKLFRRILERSGFDVRITTNLAEFRTVFAEFPPDVIFSDLQMPEVPDDSVCRVLRQECRTGETPIWLVSSIAEPELAERAVKSGADGSVSKSLEPEEFEAKLRGLGQSWAELPTPGVSGDRTVGREPA